MNMSARVWEPPEDLDLPSQVLAGWVRYGLGLLADTCEASGQPETAAYWRQKARQVEYAPMIGLDLAATVASGLQELGERWRPLRELVLRRAWGRECAAYGIGEQAPC